MAFAKLAAACCPNCCCALVHNDMATHICAPVVVWWHGRRLIKLLCIWEVGPWQASRELVVARVRGDRNI
jgi:hypothetical protein